MKVKSIKFVFSLAIYGVPHFSTGFNICLDMRQQSQLDNPERTRFLGKNQWGSTPH